MYAFNKGENGNQRKQDMRFKVECKQLQQRLSAVNKVISGKNVLAVLDNFLFELNPGKLTITGSDSENTMVTSIEVMETEGNGSVAVPSRRLLDILKELPAQGLTFYINDDTFEIDIQYLNGHVRFMGIDGKEFPQKNAQESDEISMSLPASVISKGIETTLFAAATETIRPIMTGICFDIKNDHIVMAASDGHKLVKYKNKSVEPNIERRFVLPAKPASILANLLSSEENDINFKLDSKGAQFEMSEYTLSCRLITGTYPNYDRVIPQNNPFSLTVDRVNMLGAMRRVGLSANVASSLIRLNIQDSEILLSSQDIDYSTSAEERVPCNYSGSPMTIGFQASYMIEILNNLSGDNAVCKLLDPAHAGLFMPEKEEAQEEILMLLMPMQVLDY